MSIGNEKLRGVNMISVSISEIVKATDGVLISGNSDGVVKSAVTDSRKVEEGSIFIAICGENVDGHAYVDKAFSKGSVCAIVEKDVATDNKNTVIKVENSVRAMGTFARLITDKLSVPTVAITGSVGKTTTRDMTYAVMSKKFNTLKNENNFNNEIGVPLTVFNANDDTEAMVIEMGMDNLGEIDRLSKMAVPDICMITNIGMSHIERLGSQENIYRAKSEMFKNIKPDGVIILNGDDKILMAHKNELSNKVITVGKENKDADLVASEIVSRKDSVSFKVSGMGCDFLVKLPIPGEHNVTNALLAIGAGLCHNIPCEKIAEALSDFSMTKMRMDIIKCNGITIINDCYNAAPDSVKAALSVLSKYAERKVAVLGDIAALGEYSYTAHKDLGESVVKNNIDLLFTIGENARFIAQGAFENGMDSENIISADTIDEIKPELLRNLRENDVVLVKASRVMGLERVTEILKNNF